MKRLNIPLILDTLLCLTCGFLLTFTAVRFYSQNTIFSLICGIVAALFAGTTAFLYISKKQNKSFVLSFDQKQKSLLKNHLALCSNEHITILFLKLFGSEAKTKNGKICKDNKTLFFVFKFDALNLDDAAKIIKSPEAEKAVYCSEILPEAIELLQSFDISICTIEEIYKLLKKADLLPETYLYKEQSKQNVIHRIKARFNRKLSLPLFGSGVAMLTLSYFTFYPIYYIISGGFSLCLAAVSLVFGKKS